MKVKLRNRLLWGLAVGNEIMDQVIGGGSRAYHSAKLFIWTPPRYSRRKYRDLLNRMEREKYLKKLVIDGQVQIRIADKGRQELVKNHPGLKQVSQPWDGFWRVVMFDIPEKKRTIRDSLRKELEVLGFGKMQHSCYISAAPFEDSFLAWFKGKKLAGSVLLLEAKQKHLGDPKELAKKSWDLDGVAKMYNQVIDRLTTRFGIRDQKKREEFLKRAYNDYVKVLMADPWLPKELLPDDWPAERAKKFILRAGVVKE